MITTEYAKKNNYNIVEEYIDNGYSGMLVSRPSLNKMILDIYTNKINMVIVKDISRLTRNKDETAYFTELFFPNNDVRFISVTEMIDSGTRYEIDDSIALRGMVNQFYVKDISKKVKAVKTNKKVNGEHIEAKVPYGYKREDKKVVVDTKVSNYIELIFDMYLKGYSQSQIAKHLTNLGIDTPKKYKGEKAKINEWRNDSVGRILKDPFYTGMLITNKYVSDYKTKKIKKTPIEQWNLVKGIHEAIITKEKFELVQEMLKEKYFKPKQKYNYLLRDLVFCGHCKARMQYKYRARTKIKNKVLEEPQKTWYYKCRMLYRFPSICNRGHTIKEDVLNDIVLLELKKRLNKIEIDTITGKVIDNYKKNDVDYKLLEKYKKKVNKINEDITKLYNKKLEGIIQVDDFKNEYTKLKEELKNTEETIEGLKQKCNKCELDDKFKQIIINFKNGIEFDNETIKKLVKRIEVYEDKTIDITFNI